MCHEASCLTRLLAKLALAMETRQAMLFSCLVEPSYPWGCLSTLCSGIGLQATQRLLMPTVPNPCGGNHKGKRPCKKGTDRRTQGDQSGLYKVMKPWTTEDPLGLPLFLLFFLPGSPIETREGKETLNRRWRNNVA